MNSLTTNQENLIKNKFHESLDTIRSKFRECRLSPHAFYKIAMRKTTQNWEQFCEKVDQSSARNKQSFSELSIPGGWI